MRLLYYSPALVVSGGGGSHARGLRAAFERLGHEVLALPAGPVAQAAPERAPSTLPEPIKLVGREIRAHVRHRGASALIAQVAAFRPDVAIVRRASYDLTCNALVASLACPIVAEVNAVLAVEGATWGEHIPTWEASRERAFLSAASRLCCVSAEVASDVAAIGIPAERITVVENGVDDEMFSPEVLPDAEVQAWAAGRSHVVGYTGSVGALHDIATLVRAADAVLDAQPDAGFLWIGLSAEQLAAISSARVRSASLCLGCVQQERVPGALVVADVCWGAFNFGYGSPLKVYEYAALAKPIAVAGEGMPARVAEASGAALVVPRADAAGLGQAVVRVLGDDLLRRELGARGRSWVTADHTWVQVARSMLEGVAR